MKFAKLSNGHFATKIGMLVCTIGELVKKMAFLKLFIYIFGCFYFYFYFFA